MQNHIVACVMVASCVIARAADKPAEFQQAFARHQAAGSLFHYQTPREFEAKGWGTHYRDSIAAQFKGAPVDQLGLQISITQQYKAQTGVPIALTFRLHNDSKRDVPVTVGGNCNTVHQAIFMVIDPQGRLHQSLGQGKVGGPHCFCQQREQTLRAGSSVQLDTKTDSGDVIGFVPSVAGKYVIVGIYHVPTKENPERRILSQPLLVAITAQQSQPQ